MVKTINITHRLGGACGVPAPTFYPGQSVAIDAVGGIPSTRAEYYTYRDLGVRWLFHIQHVGG